jgi:hypothetical protein
MSSPSPNFQPLLLEMSRRNTHGEIRLATGAGKGRRHIGLFALRALDTENEHVFGHPALVASDVRGDTQRSVSPVTGSVAPNLTSFWEMHNIFIGIARPWNVLLTRIEGRPYGVNARNDALRGPVDFFEKPAGRYVP